MNLIPGEIHVGLGNGSGGNYNDWYTYNIENDEWTQRADFPSSKRHHPFYFSINMDSYVGLGHASGSIERDWHRYDSASGAWYEAGNFESYALDGLTDNPVTTEARVAGTQFTIAGSCDSAQTFGFVLSGDGDNHRLMETGEFHVFDAEKLIWYSLPPHPGVSRWAPGTFVPPGSSRVYFIGGKDRKENQLMKDMWTMDLRSLYEKNEDDDCENVSSFLWRKNKMKDCSWVEKKLKTKKKFCKKKIKPSNQRIKEVCPVTCNKC